MIVPSVVSLLGVSGFRPGVRDINPGTKPSSHKKRPVVGIDCLETQSAAEDVRKSFGNLPDVQVFGD